MQISAVSEIKKNKTPTYSVTVTMKNGKEHDLFFSVPLSQKNFVTADATPFLAVMLPVAMRLREDITVSGSVSERFIKNTHEIMKLFKKWDVGLSPVHIHATSVVNDKKKGKRIASFFSAGVDSFYTYLMHKKEIDTFFLVHGFDIELTNQSFFHDVQKTVTTVAKQEKKNLCLVTTNVKEITDLYVSWDFAHGAALAAVGLLHRVDIKKIYIAGAVRKNQLFPYGTHPDLDPLWSTETLRFVHDGNERTRLEKLRDVVTKSDLAMNNLRVCCQNHKGKYNCSQCFKCLNTMIQLVCVNSLDKAKTFDKTINLQAVRNMYYNYKLKYNYFAEANLAILKKENREADLQQAIVYSLEKSKNPSLVRKAAFFVAALDKRYNNRRLFRYIFRVTNSEDRTFLFKVLAQRGIIK